MTDRIKSSIVKKFLLCAHYVKGTDNIDFLTGIIWFLFQVLHFAGDLKTNFRARIFFLGAYYDKFKMLASRPVISRVMQQFARRYHGDHGHFKPPSMDELPVPKGSWQAQYDANQRRYNSILLFGIAFAAGTIIIGKSTGLIYLNYSPPKSLD